MCLHLLLAGKQKENFNLLLQTHSCQNLSTKGPFPCCQLRELQGKPCTQTRISFPCSPLTGYKPCSLQLLQPQHGAPCWGFQFCFFLASRNTFSAFMCQKDFPSNKYFFKKLPRHFLIFRNLSSLEIIIYLSTDFPFS